MPDHPFHVPGAAAAIVALVPAAFYAPGAYAVDYLSTMEAQAQMFPAATAFVPLAVTLSAEQIKQIEVQSGVPLNTAFWKVSVARNGEQLLGYVVTDAVVGKFQLINYAVAFTADGHIRDVEVLSYREAHGGEVRSKAWRAQFAGKDASAPLAVGNDIANISGATMSCTHLTDGIRRIAHYVQIALAAPAAPATTRKP